MTRPVVLCADDYGMSEGVSRGIAELAETGRISATSVMANGQAWPAAASRLRPLAGRIGIGLHLNLTWGAPLGAMPGLAPDGALPALRELLGRAFAGRLNRREIEDEIARQLDAVAGALGRMPDFVDGHQHVHVLPGIRRALLRVLGMRGAGGLWLRDPGDTPRAIVARRGSVGKAALLATLASGFARDAGRAGVRTNRGFSGFSSFKEADMAEAFSRYFSELGPSHVVMCHPGYVDAGNALDGVTDARRRELDFLSSRRFVDLLGSKGVELAPAPNPCPR